MTDYTHGKLCLPCAAPAQEPVRARTPMYQPFAAPFTETLDASLDPYSPNRRLAVSARTARILPFPGPEAQRRGRWALAGEGAPGGQDNEASSPKIARYSLQAALRGLLKRSFRSA